MENGCWVLAWWSLVLVPLRFVSVQLPVDLDDQLVCSGQLLLHRWTAISFALNWGTFLLLCVSVVTARNCEGPPKAHYIEPLQAMQIHCARAGSYYFEPGNNPVFELGPLRSFDANFKVMQVD